MNAGAPPSRTFSIDGRQYTVRMIRQYEAGRGSIWRDYGCASGGQVAIEARGPGGRRTEPEKNSAYSAARRFAGYL